MVNNVKKNHREEMLLHRNFFQDWLKEGKLLAEV